jgi:hypothetical protein
MDPLSLPVIFDRARRQFQAWNVAVFRNCSTRICGKMPLDFPQELRRNPSVFVRLRRECSESPLNSSDNFLPFPPPALPQVLKTFTYLEAKMQTETLADTPLYPDAHQSARHSGRSSTNDVSCKHFRGRVNEYQETKYTGLVSRL